MPVAGWPVESLALAWVPVQEPLASALALAVRQVARSASVAVPCWAHPHPVQQPDVSVAVGWAQLSMVPAPFEEEESSSAAERSAAKAPASDSALQLEAQLSQGVPSE